MCDGLLNYVIYVHVTENKQRLSSMHLLGIKYIESKIYILNALKKICIYISRLKLNILVENIYVNVFWNILEKYGNIFT